MYPPPVFVLPVTLLGFVVGFLIRLRAKTKLGLPKARVDSPTRHRRAKFTRSLSQPDAASLCLFAGGLGWLGAGLAREKSRADCD